MSFETDVTRKIADIEQELSRLRSFESPQTVPKTNYNAVSDPTVNDDTADGYSEGSRWVNATTNVLFECVDATAGAAIWVPIPKSNYSATTAPGPTNDVDESYRPGSRWLDTINDRLYECVDNTNNAAIWLPVWPSFGDICADFANLAGCRGVLVDGAVWLDRQCV